MSTRTHTPAAPSPAREPGRRKARTSRWPVAAAAIVVLVALAIAAMWFLGRSAPDEAAELPQRPDEVAEEPQRPDEAVPEIVYGQEPRANWDVTGVAGGDRLNVRTGPGVHNDVKATLAPDAVELESTGRIARVDGVLWREIVVPGDGAGWVHAGYLTETATER